MVRVGRFFVNEALLVVILPALRHSSVIDGSLAISTAVVAAAAALGMGRVLAIGQSARGTLAERLPRAVLAPAQVEDDASCEQKEEDDAADGDADDGGRRQG